MEKLSSTRIDPSLGTVIVVAKEVHQASSTPDKNNSKCQNSEESNRSTKERKTGSSVNKGSVKKSLAEPIKLTTDNKLEQLDQKWSERFIGDFHPTSTSIFICGHISSSSYQALHTYKSSRSTHYF